MILKYNNWKNSKYENLDLFLNKNFSLYENEKINPNFTNEIKKIISELNLNLKIVGFFSTGVAAFYPIVEKLIKNELPDFKKEQIILLIISALFAIFDIKEKRDKILEKLKFEKVYKFYPKILKSIKNSLKMMKMMLLESGYSIKKLSEVLSFTSIMVPIMNGLTEYISKNNLSFHNFQEILNGLLISSVVIGLKNLLPKTWNKIKSSFK